MRTLLSVLVVSLGLLAVAGTAAAQPCQPWCLDLDDSSAATATGGTVGAVQALLPAMIAGLAVALRHRRDRG